MAPAATRIAVSRAEERPPPRWSRMPYFSSIGEIGMAGPEAARDVAVVLRPLVDILDHQRDRRAGGQALEHAGEDADLVGFLPLGGEFRLAGPAAVQPGLDIGLGQRNARRAAIDDAADRRPVALAPGGDAEQMAEAVVRHASFAGASAPAPQPMTVAISGASGFFMPTMW